MKTWIRRSLIVLASTTVLLGGLSACGQVRHGHSPMSAEKVSEMRSKLIERTSDKLELDTAQREKLGVLADRMIAQRSALMGQTTDPRSELKALVAAEKFDRARALVLLDEKTRVLQVGTPEVINALADFYDSLKPEQQAELRELMDKRRGWFGRG